MVSAQERVIEEALLLPADIRLNLIEKLLSSLNLPVSEEIDRLWAEEAEKRAADIDSGTARIVPGDEVFGKIRAKYGK